MIHLYKYKLKPVFIHIISILIYLCDGILYYWISLKNLIVVDNKNIDFKNIPIVINNYNRVTYLKDLVDCLKNRGYNNIHIIDNNSTYPPLLKYYDECNCHVYRLKKNLGFKAFTISGIYKEFKNQYFVYTDSDIFLPDECPDDILEYFYQLLMKYPFVSKVGCALKINDIPDSFALKQRVQEWEKKFWKVEKCRDVYIGRLDTTFALYKPNFSVGSSRIGKNLRVAGKYIAIHKPWYVDSNNPSIEEQYYLNSATTSTFWSKRSKV